MATEPLLLIIGLLLAISVAATRASNRFGIPALILFITIGMLAGSDGPGGIAFTDAAASATDRCHRLDLYPLFRWAQIPTGRLSNRCSPRV